MGSPFSLRLPDYAQNRYFRDWHHPFCYQNADDFHFYSISHWKKSKVIVSENHPLAKYDSLTLEQIKTNRLLLQMSLHKSYAGI